MVAGLCMAESGCSSCPPSATAASTENVEGGLTFVKRVHQSIRVHLLAFWVHVFSGGCAGKGACFDVQTAVGACPCCTGDSTADKGFFIWDVNIQCAPGMKSSSISMERSWALERQCKTHAGTLC